MKLKEDLQMNTYQNKLYTKNITKFYGDKCVIEDINIELKDNELVSLLGISGVRKDYCF